MKSAELEAELFAARDNVKQAHLNRIREQGVSPGSLARLGAMVPPFGVARVLFGSDNLFEFVEDGTPAAIVGAFGPCDLGSLGVEDLVAFEIARPDRWYWRVGQATCLGSHLLDDERWQAIPIGKDPLDFLRAAGQSLIILDWGDASPIWARLRRAPGLSFPDETLRRRVEAAMLRSVPLPTMEVQRAYEPA